MQLDALILRGSPETLDEDVVEAAPCSVHRDPGADPFQPVGPNKGRELRTLIGVQYLGRPKPWSASFNASTQKSAASVFEMRQARTLRVNQSMTKGKTPRRIGREIVLAHQT
ncbi:hypothetical protein [Salipiger aestuarii]|uniref:hypothetical protein n=1 Tax=Salipiger aestuarii TaxID=568098 RepID=UPI0016800FF7|nr:hypothetical protein [Salipiger aestuarii]